MNYLKTFSIALSTLLFVSCGDDKTTPDDPQLPDNGNYVGTLTVMAGTDSEFTLEDVEVTFAVSEDETTADIEMLKVKFAEAMPVTLDVFIPAVTLNSTTSGYTVSCGEEGIIPTAMNGTEFPDKIFTEMSGSVTTTTMSLEMKSGGDPLTFEGVVTSAE
jgi:hypothetical protein